MSSANCFSKCVSKSFLLQPLLSGLLFPLLLVWYLMGNSLELFDICVCLYVLLAALLNRYLWINLCIAFVVWHLFAFHRPQPTLIMLVGSIFAAHSRWCVCVCVLSPSEPAKSARRAAGSPQLRSKGNFQPMCYVFMIVGVLWLFSVCCLWFIFLYICPTAVLCALDCELNSTFAAE